MNIATPITFKLKIFKHDFLIKNILLKKYLNLFTTNFKLKKI